MATMSMGARGRGASLPPTAGGILLNFVMMSLCFSLNHGCVTSCLALASAQLGPKLGGYSSGVLYAFYTLTALLLAPDVVRRLGSKGALDWGLFLYCAYVGSYAVALVCPSLRWPAVLFGAALGGLAAGWNWTAQGDFFGRAAELYAYTLQVERETATAFLSGVFATLYLGLELGLKLVSSFVLSRPGWERAPTALFVIYTCVALGASVGMLLVRPLREAQPPPGAPPAARAAPRAEPGSPKLLLALALMQRDPKILLLAPINTAFGFMASLMNFYVNGVLVKTTMGAPTIGVLTSVISGVATACSLPISWLSARVGKGPVLQLGAAMFGAEVLALLLFSPSTLGHWRPLLALYAAHGVGRAIWEGPNRALIADLFSDNREGAFANTIMQSGLASTVGYFAFPSLIPHAGARPLAMGATCLVNVVLAVLGYAAAAAMHVRQRREQAALYESLIPGGGEDGHDSSGGGGGGSAHVPVLADGPAQPEPRGSQVQDDESSRRAVAGS